MRLKQSRAMFTTSDRCVVRDNEEHMVSDTEGMKKLYELALAQGFKVEPVQGSKLKWTHPDGASRVTPTRAIGRGYKNIETQLKSIGLDVSALKPQPKKERTLDSPLEPKTEAVLVEATDAMPLLKSTEDKESPVILLTRTLSNYTTMSHDLVHVMVAQVLEHTRTIAEMFDVEKLETQLLEALEERDTLLNQLEKANERVSKMGVEIKELTQKHLAEQERASKAENRLRTLKSALSDD